MIHTCHWPGCKKEVPPSLWGCGNHWYKLPAALRAKIWCTYVAGQEITKTPSVEYIAAANEVQAWIKSSLQTSAASQTEIDWDEKRIDTIGQNGNDGLHYN